MKKLILLIFTLSIIIGVLLACGSKMVDPIDNETTDSPSEDTSAESTENVIDDFTESNETNQSENTETDDRLTEITEENQEIALPKYNYVIEKRDGKYYMVFDSYAINPPEFGYEEAGILTTLDKIKREIPFGILNDRDKESLLGRYVNDTVRAQGFDFYDIEHIWKPIIPDGWTLKNEVRWDRDIYRFTATLGETLEDISSVAEITIYTEDKYNERYNKLDLQSMTILQNGNMVYTIDRKEFQILDHISYSHYIWCSDGNFFAQIAIDGYREFTNDEILEFGVEEYLG